MPLFRPLIRMLSLMSMKQDFTGPTTRQDFVQFLEKHALDEGKREREKTALYLFVSIWQALREKGGGSG